MTGQTNSTNYPTTAGAFDTTHNGFNDGFVTSVSLPASTAANVAVGGRVTTAEGTGISNVRVSLTDQSGNVRTAFTGSFGYYLFDEVEVGQLVVISIAAKRYAFANPMRIVTVHDELTDMDFTAEPQ